MDSDTKIDLMFGAVALVIILVGFLRRYTGSNMSGDEPVLTSQGLLEGSNVTTVHRGSSEGYTYNLLANTKGRLIAFVGLGSTTNLHVVAIGDKSGLRSGLSKGRLRKFLTPVQLEGDFPKYMSMYVTKDHEQELLELFDPADMAYFVDFCRAYNFEIFKDTLYISQAGDARDSDDQTTLIADTEKFLHKNSRWLKRVGSDIA